MTRRATKTAARDIAPSYTLKVPRAARKSQFGTAETIQRMRALIDGGYFSKSILSQYGIRRRVGRAIGLEDINKIMELYAQFKPLLDLVLPLIEKYFSKDKKPAPIIDAGEDTDDDGNVTHPVIPDGGDDEEADDEPREVVGGKSELFWVTRKRTPYKKAGGRDLLSDAARDRIKADQDPLQAGDRACYNVSPKDQNGVYYRPEDPENADIKSITHQAHGMGEIQQQEERDFTPVVLVPWEGVAVDTKGTIGITSTIDGVDIKGKTLRVHTWGA